MAALEIPTRTRSFRAERVFNLRRLSSQAWLNSTLRSELPFAVFVFPRPLPGLPQRDLTHHIPEDYPWVALYRASYQKDVIDFAPEAVTSTGLILDESDDGTFRFLLPALVVPGRGGSAVTEAIATVLRLAGARGMVYPSARNDIVCVCRDDEPVHWSGWCFVDYSAFDIAWPQYRIIYDPASWLSRARLQFAVRPAGDRHAGSWKLTGLRARTERFHLQLVEDWLNQRADARLDGETESP